MNTSSDLKIKVKVQHLEELKKYRSYNYKGEDKLVSEILKDIQGLLIDHGGNLSGIKCPEAGAYSFSSDDIHTVEAHYLEYTKITQSSTDPPAWPFVLLYLISIAAVANSFSEGNWPTSISGILSLLIVSVFLGGALMFPMGIVLAIIWIPIGKFSISNQLRRSNIITSNMIAYEFYRNDLLRYLDDIAKHLLRNIETEIETIKAELKRAQRKKEEYWQSMSGHEFEREMASLLCNIGHSVKRTKGSGDMGVDLFLDETIIVQCKATKSAVSPSVARDLLGTMSHFNADKGILISTGGFTSGTKAFCRDNNIELWDIEKVLSLAETIQRDDTLE